ncbi:MAG: hypothetical protein HC824_07025 [Synechococcales cyanobacterium RM1_1_8]|nr:hypothetical protein [Synechococcales cyanobacterium RM1_1_8]
MAAASVTSAQGDTERLEKRFELYTKMTSQTKQVSSKKPKSHKNKS